MTENVSPEIVEEQAAYVWTLESQARVGSYQHEVSSAPWMILAAERAHLRTLAQGDR